MPVQFAGGNANAAAASGLQQYSEATNTAVYNSVAVALNATVGTNGFGETTVTLTFVDNTPQVDAGLVDPVSAENGGGGFGPVSLADGLYQLTIVAADVSYTSIHTRDLAGDGTNAGSNYVTATQTGYVAGGPNLFRLFGDATGNGIVDQLDLAMFRSANNSSIGISEYLYYFDSDNSGTIDQFDLAQFRARNNWDVFDI